MKQARGRNNLFKLLFGNSVLINGNGSSPVRDVGVLIDGGRIEAVGKSLDAPRGAKRIDAEGMTLMPGLMDLHVPSMGDDEFPAEMNIFYGEDIEPHLDSEQACSFTNLTISRLIPTVG